jgi:hypothetical protein
MTHRASDTLRIAHAAGWDAGNRNMRTAGRTVWSEEDWNAAAEVTAKVLGVVLPVGEDR